MKENRGQLKIFFSYAPGVGKTFAMLRSAKEMKKKVTVHTIETVEDFEKLLGE